MVDHRVRHQRDALPFLPHLRSAEQEEQLRHRHAFRIDRPATSAEHILRIPGITYFVQFQIDSQRPLLSGRNKHRNIGFSAEQQPVLSTGLHALTR